MANFEIWDVLSTGLVSADSTFDLGDSTYPTAQQVIPEDGVKNQIIHLADDNSETVVSLSNESVFHLSLQYGALNESESGELLYAWHSSDLADGISNTFRYTHPTDGHTYTVRFSDSMIRERRVGNIFGVPSMSLRILGRAT